MRSIFSIILAASSLYADEAARKLYVAQCARCHGDEGQGTKKYPAPLIGDRSVAQLADVIQKTMPENDPGSLSVEQSKAIAAEIHGRFYSKVAQARKAPARVELARLTVKQYRQAVADLIGSFRPSVPFDEKRGLSGDYFNKTFQMDMRGKGILQRVDDNVDFDFGTASPLPGKLEHHTYSIQWKGSLIAPETGEYEFAVRTEHAGRLYVNDLKVPIIDAWVKSGKETEFKGRIFLVGGRAYPIQLDYSKGRQGKADNEKKQAEPPPVKSSIRLSWKRPHGALEPIASRHLVPVIVSEQYIVSAKFPPDDRSLGWERGTAVSKEWDDATTEAALDAAAYVNLKLNSLAGAASAEKCKAFSMLFAERAWRRPLTSEQKAIIERQFRETPDPALAVKKVVLMALKSPFFLYREVAGGNDAYDTASRLSFALWDSIPDEALLKAAAAGKLKTEAEIRGQAERMLADPRAKFKLRDFLFTWLKADQPHDLTKDAKKYPGFDEAIIGDLRTSIELTIDETISSPNADYRSLLLGDEVYFNDRLAKYYGVEKKEPGFSKVTFDAGKRAGVLTHPYLLSSFAYHAESSPIHRGVFLARGVLGVAMRPPPEAVAPLSPDLHPDLTTRERTILQTNANACMTCHGVINPLGFTLEHFDAVGRYRETDHGKPIDARGNYRTESGKVVEVNGARELAKFVAVSGEAHEAFAEQLFHHLVQQPVRAYGINANEELRASFEKYNFNIRKLSVECAARSVLKERR